MAWVNSAVNDQRLSAMPNPVGWIWDETHPAQGPPGWDPQKYWQWEDVRLLLTFIPSRMRSGPDRAVVLMFRPIGLPAPAANPLGLRPQNLQRLFSYCCGSAQASACPVGERLVGACSHCATALCFTAVYPAHPAAFTTTHRGFYGFYAKNGHILDPLSAPSMSMERS